MSLFKIVIVLVSIAFIFPPFTYTEKGINLP